MHFPGLARRCYNTDAEMGRFPLRRADWIKQLGAERVLVLDLRG